MPRRRRPSQVLKAKLAAPRSSQGWFGGVVDWLFRSESASAFSLGVLFAIGLTVSYIMPARISDGRALIAGAFAFLLFGTFLGVIVVTEDNKNYRGNGLRARVVCGAIAVGAIVALASAPAEAIVLGVLFGAILGFFGMSWAKYI